VLSELKKKLVSDLSGYMTFWNLFGPVLKEGLCEASSPREQILEVCRFFSTHEEHETTTSLDEYVARMKPEQEAIYYLTGENLTNLRASPQIEGFLKRGIEVVLLSDHVDDFWVNVVSHYKGKALKSVTRADIKLDQFPLLTQEEDKKEQQAPEADVVTLCARIKTILGDAVKDVRPSDKLSTSAVCLAVEEGAMDIRLERFLLEQRQLQQATPKILEINPAHPIISGMIQRETIDDIVWILFDQARIMEGEAITDPAAFTRRLQSFVEKSLAA
jgi:molecular chaperone HtpG